MKEKTPLSHEVVCFQMLDQIRGKLLLSRKHGTSEGAFSHNVLYYQPLPFTRHQVISEITVDPMRENIKTSV